MYADKGHAKIRIINFSFIQYLTLFVFPIEDEDASTKLFINDPNNNNDNSVFVAITTKYDGAMAVVAVAGFFFVDDDSVIFITIIAQCIVSKLKIEETEEWYASNINSSCWL